MKLIEISIGTGPDEPRRQASLVFKGDGPNMAGDMARLWFAFSPDHAGSLENNAAAAKRLAAAMLQACLDALGE